MINTMDRALDLILTDAKITTMDPELPEAEALATRQDGLPLADACTAIRPVTNLRILAQGFSKEGAGDEPRGDASA